MILCNAFYIRANVDGKIVNKPTFTSYKNLLFCVCGIPKDSNAI